MNKIYLTLSRLVFAISDLFLVNLSLFLCFYFFAVHANPLEPSSICDFSVSSGIWIFSNWLFNSYDPHTIVKFKNVRRATLRSVSLYLLLFIPYLLIFRATPNSAAFLLSFTAIITLSFTLTRYTYTTFEYLLIKLIDKDEAVNVFAIASIGGHWVQLLRLMPLFNMNDVSFVSTKPGLKDTVDGHKYYLVPDANRNNKTDLVRCCLSIGAKIVFARPKVIVTTGAAPGLFGIFIGKVLGVKTIWIDSIANVEKLSLSGKIASRMADRVYTQWEHLATPKIIYAGNILEG
ncbi:hypothetical protein OQY15_01475 [Pedobacter sp. MC2016-15]|uniref:hypothetical protein n=1 Tax=Pedobacter sp. MC2016-15 TaxID=2994473 RepID=UPI0022465C62|nr:hypothetical protein [Pedobacter sp. MC2016-15]MCX2477739.1 hypothetical protein [Pedobacter sp. MC2016-15]